MSRHMDSVTTTQAFQSQVFHLKGTCAETTLLDCSGRDSSKRFCLKMDGRTHQPGNACLSIVSRVYSCPSTVDDIKIDGRAAQSGTYAERIDETC